MNEVTQSEKGVSQREQRGTKKEEVIQLSCVKDAAAEEEEEEGEHLS